MINRPAKIHRQGSEGIEIIWSNGEAHFLSSNLLRTNCPSADSRAKRGDSSHDRPLAAKKSMLTIVEASSSEETDLQEIWGIGNYALGMRWKDGHDSGIYTYEFLYNLGQKQK